MEGFSEIIAWWPVMLISTLTISVSYTVLVNFSLYGSSGEVDNGLPEVRAICFVIYKNYHS